MGLLDMLGQALGQSHNVSGEHFDQVAGQVSPNVMSSALSEVFRSNQTPDMGSLVGQMFANSNGNQQAGLLNQILTSLGPAAAATLAGGVLGKVMAPGSGQITPEQASKLSQEEVRAVVEHANQQQPGISDQIANFYAEHSGLIKTLGGAAMIVALAKMKDHLGQK